MKTGKRNRFAHRAFPSETGGFTTNAGVSFVDDILSGDVQFKPLGSVPEFEPEYLREASGVAEVDSFAYFDPKAALPDHLDDFVGCKPFEDPNWVKKNRLWPPEVQDGVHAFVREYNLKPGAISESVSHHGLPRF